MLSVESASYTNLLCMDMLRLWALGFRLSFVYTSALLEMVVNTALGFGLLRFYVSQLPFHSFKHELRTLFDLLIRPNGRRSLTDAALPSAILRGEWLWG